MKVISAIAGALLMLVVQPASAQAVWGVTQGTASTALNVKRAYDNNDYSIFPSKPEAEFESYMVTAPPGVGVCRITALGVSYLGANGERDVKAAFARVRSAIDAKFGASELLTYRKKGDAVSFFDQILSEDAGYSAFWPAGIDENSPPLDVNVASIGLSILALKDGDLYLSLRYEFRNFKTGCRRQ